MVRIIDVCSGKGGVGKTVVTANLAAALQSLGKSVALIDCNLTTSHLGLHIGMHNNTKTVNNYLRNEIRLEDAVCMHHSNMKFVPASLQVRDLVGIDASGMKDDIKRVFADCDFVFLDSAPGLGKEALIAMNASDELLFVATPHIPSLVDISKYAQFSNTINHKPLGIILNRVKNKKYEIMGEDVLYFTELPIIGTVPEDEEILKSVNEKKILVLHKPKARSSKAFYRIAHTLTGINKKERRSLFSMFRMARKTS